MFTSRSVQVSHARLQRAGIADAVFGMVDFSVRDRAGASGAGLHSWYNIQKQV